MTHSPQQPVAERPPTVALVGVHGHGQSHLRNLVRLHAAGRLRIAGLADPAPFTDDDARAVVAAVAAEPRDAATDTDGRAAVLEAPLEALLAAPRFAGLQELLAAPGGPPDVVVLCTPIHTHAPLAVQAMEAGCDVLMEKPPTASSAELSEVLAAQDRTGRVVQVGFQTFGSGALPALHDLVAAGEIGDVTGVGGVGTWVRPLDYWTRSAWTGRRSIDGRPVVDGVVTNPLAHAVATALHLAGATRAEDVARVELDQYRANDIECDDTSAVRVTTTAGIPVTLGLTLCARVHSTPRVVVQGSQGQAVLDYYTDTLEVTGPAGTRTVRCDRTDLLSNLLQHRADGSPLLCPTARTGAFMQVLDAVRAAPDPARVAAEHVERVVDELGTHLVVRDVEHWCARAAAEHRTFAELGAPWATAEKTGGPS